MQSYFFENSSRLTSGTELTEVEQILRYFRRDIYKKKNEAKFTGWQWKQTKLCALRYSC